MTTQLLILINSLLVAGSTVVVTALALSRWYQRNLRTARWQRAALEDWIDAEMRGVGRHNRGVHCDDPDEKLYQPKPLPDFMTSTDDEAPPLPQLPKP